MDLRLALIIVGLVYIPIQGVHALTFEHCLQQQFEQSDDNKTLGELRRYCQKAVIDDNVASITNQDELVGSFETSALTQRLKFEQRVDQNPFTLLPHKPNYILISNNLASPNEQPFQQAFPDRAINIQPWETKFQISLKLPVARGLFDGNGDLFVAYTNRSFWQQFNKQGSSPFRDSNHEPEIWLSFKNDKSIFGLHNSIIRTGVAHQSNGQSGSLSRSWNRIYADFIFEQGNWYFSLKPWWRIPESAKNDDNPDIDNYLGNFEFGALYKKGKHSFDVLARNNLDFGDNHGAVQLGWSFPISNNVHGYVQWFNGYGESLIDYNSYSNSIGLGIKLTDWL
ncbi:MAG: phospholipase A [Gammaproteobacteria bacterium]|nr:phospholipase A [Gammaproteobacteria bacterium]